MRLKDARSTRSAVSSKDLTSAMVKNYGVPADAVVVTVVETAKHDKAKGGVLFSEMSAPPHAKAS